MRFLEIKDYYSPDVDEVWGWEPQSDEEVFFLLELSIGKCGDDKYDLFSVVVATPSSIQKHPNEIQRSKRVILLENYSWTRLVNLLGETVRESSKETWEESVKLLSEKFHWEYENYVVDP